MCISTYAYISVLCLSSPCFPSGTCGELWAKATGGLSSIGCRFPAQRNARKRIKGISRLPAFKERISFCSILYWPLHPHIQGSAAGFSDFRQGAKFWGVPTTPKLVNENATNHIEWKSSKNTPCYNRTCKALEFASIYGLIFGNATNTCCFFKNMFKKASQISTA